MSDDRKLPDQVPGFWMNETTGVLRPAVMAYFEGKPLDPRQAAALRAYLRQWMAAPAWRGPMIDPLRTAVEEIIDRESLDRWITMAEFAGIDPF